MLSFNFVVPAGTIVILVAIIGLNIVLTKLSINALEGEKMWNLKCSILFVASLGQLGRKHFIRIKKYCNLSDDDECVIFIVFQLASIIEIIVVILVFYMSLAKIFRP